MFKTITAAHPGFEDKLAPVSDLLAVAEEGGRALAYAPSRTLYLLMNYVHVARTGAYERTGDLAHVCALFEDTDRLLARKDAPDLAVEEAYHARGKAAELCTPARSTASTATTPGTLAEPPRPRRLRTPAERQQGRKMAGFGLGATLLGGSVVTLALGFGIGGHNLSVGEREVDSVLADIQARGGRTPHHDLILQTYDRRQDSAQRLMLGMGITAAVMVVVGAGLLSWSLKGGSPLRARLSPYGGPHGAGLSLAGRF